jgi:CDP-glucose 4,6-dehydratase
MNKNFWQDKTILVTGHTGFKGSWLSLWLQQMGAKVIGYSLEPPTEPSIFKAANVGQNMTSIQGDVLNAVQLRDVMATYRPSIVFHLAAQALVRRSYQDPLETLAVNVMGTANVLDAVRHSSSDVKVLLNITSDKCYENKEWEWGYREDEPMGGYDPYSSSKGCAELVTAAFRKSYFSANGMTTSIATARAGNVFGGGDWAEDRLIPDCIKAINRCDQIVIRSPGAVRPWQHVLEPIRGYLLLAEQLWENGADYAEGWNFGPGDDGARPVHWVVNKLCNLWGEAASWQVGEQTGMHEARLLKLDCSKAKYRLGWKPRWELQQGLQKTVDWYKAYFHGEDMLHVTLKQIMDYSEQTL